MNRPAEPGAIVSLYPAGTELLFVLDAWDRVEAVSHECDFPPMTERLPKASRSRVDAGLPPRELDAAVKELSKRGESLYEVDAELLARLKPQLIVTQALCDVCAITPKELERATKNLDPAPDVLQLNPTSFGEVLEQFRVLGKRLDHLESARRELLKQWSLAKQIRGMVREMERPRVAVLDWVDPLMFAGHWTQELAQMAGAECTLVGVGEKSRWGSWDELEEYEPDLIVAAPCGRGVEAAAAELARTIQANDLWDLAAVEQGRVFACDGNRYFNRPGPRLIYSAALLARAAHWGRVPSLPPALETGISQVVLARPPG